MKQNVPYKPLSSHAATRPSNNIANEEPASHSFHIKEQKTVSATVDGQRKLVKNYHFQPNRFNTCTEPPDPLDDNLFFADIASNNAREYMSKDKTRGTNPSAQSNQEHTDETNFDSASHGKINMPYFDSFGKKGQLDEMVLKDQVRESAIFNMSESQQLNFTFGNSNFNKGLIRNNSSLLKSSQFGNLQESAQLLNQRESIPFKSTSQGVHEFAQETPPHSQKSQRLKIPIKIVSSAGKLLETNKEEGRSVLKSNPLKPPRMTPIKREEVDPSFSRERSKGQTIVSQLKPEKLVIRKPQ
jgi:hypothetical protein